jgi:lipopolysaccharide export system permease protein
VKVTTARKGIMQLTPNKRKVVFTLFDGYTYAEITDQDRYKEKRPFESMKFSEQKLTFDLSEFQLSRTNEQLFKSHYSMLNIKQLNKSIDSLSSYRIQRIDFFKKKFVRGYSVLGKNDTILDTLLVQADTCLLLDSLTYPLVYNFDREVQAEIVQLAQGQARNAKEDAHIYYNELESRSQVISKHEVAWHQKFRLSVACLIFFFIGAPLGAIIRKGGLGLPVVVSVLFFVLYHVVTMMGEKAVKTGEWEPIPGIWMSTFLILPIGLFLTYKATTDAPLLDAESWKKSLERFNFIKKLKKI